MSKRRSIFFAACIAFLGLLTYIVSTVGTTTFDTAILEWFYSIRSEKLTQIFKGITFLANTDTIKWMCIILLVIPPLTKKVGIPVTAAAIVGGVLNRSMKLTIMRPRPDAAMHLIEKGGWSFTSGHSCNSIIMYGLLAWLIRRYAKDKKTANILTVILTLLWIAIGISRLYLGVHYPTDVLGGWTLGMLVVLITITKVEKVERKKELK